VKILLVALNAKYPHVNLAVRLLKAYSGARCASVRDGVARVSIGEWNVNEPPRRVLRGIAEAGPDAVLFSTYLWNRALTVAIARDVRRLLPGVIVGFGGPEATWSVGSLLAECPGVDFVVAGEGEETFAEVVDLLAAVPATRADRLAAISSVRGVRARGADGVVRSGGDRPPIADLGSIPFPYVDLDFDPTHRIVYHESSRGCPFSCAYCLSARDEGVRYYPLERALADVDWFLSRKVPLVKYVDRTFNLDPERARAILSRIRDGYTGVTRFHFEIAPELVDSDLAEILASMPAGSVQLEAGIQSARPETLRAVSRPARLEEARAGFARIPRGIHTHVDLIAGLPGEGIESFARSFDFAFSLGADMLQLGFLKVLPGAPIEEIALADPGYTWSASPPYEVLRTPNLSFEELSLLKDVEAVFDVWYNGSLARTALARLASGSDGAFAAFRALADFARGWFADHDLSFPRRPADAFACVAAFIESRADRSALECLRYDFLLRGKPGAFPPWFVRRYDKAAHDRAIRDVLGPVPRRVAYARSELETFAFDPRTGSGGETALLFLYGDDGSCVIHSIVGEKSGRIDHQPLPKRDG